SAEPPSAGTFMSRPFTTNSSCVPFGLNVGDAPPSVPWSGANATPAIGREKSRGGWPPTLAAIASVAPFGEIAIARPSAGMATLSGTLTGYRAYGSSGTVYHASATNAPAAAAAP